MSRVSVTNQQKYYSLLSIIRDELSVHCTKEKINREVCENCLVFSGHSQHSVICDRFVLCDLRLCNVMNASLVITLDYLVLGRVVSKWSVSLVPLVILP